ncbi:MAG: DUF115 domain-containing protein, partial [Lysinibacillus sp.]|nr:DUF115 domain-containing protein [Lysinibacillus sp.]
MTELQLEYIKGKTGYETIKVNGYFLHSKYDPIREAKEFAKRNYKIGEVHILFGYGKGYFVDAFLNEFSANEKLIVIEPLLTTMPNRMNNNNYIFLQSDLIEEITEYINRFSHLFKLNNVHILCSPNYDKVFPELYRDVLNNLKEKLLINSVNINTINYMAQEWQRNYIYYIKNAIHEQTIDLFYKYTNSPVVVASGGPSLTKQIPLIKSVRDKVILIASGSTVNSLIKENIEPDFVVSIDSTEANFNHFKDLKLKHAKLIYHMFHHYRIRDSFLSDAYFFISKSENALESHFTKIVTTNMEKLYTGETVAISALDFANYITSGPIALIGQDLAYTGNKSHAENNKNYKMITEEDIKRRE